MSSNRVIDRFGNPRDWCLVTIDSLGCRSMPFLWTQREILMGMFHMYRILSVIGFLACTRERYVSQTRIGH